jgi:hypothetical protein
MLSGSSSCSSSPPAWQLAKRHVVQVPATVMGGGGVMGGGVMGGGAMGGSVMGGGVVIPLQATALAS